MPNPLGPWIKAEKLGIAGIRRAMDLAEKVKAGRKLSKAELTEIAGSQDLSRLIYDHVDDNQWWRLRKQAMEQVPLEVFPPRRQGAFLIQPDSPDLDFNLTSRRKGLSPRQSELSPRDLETDPRSMGVAPSQMGVAPSQLGVPEMEQAARIKETPLEVDPAIQERANELALRWQEEARLAATGDLSKKARGTRKYRPGRKGPKAMVPVGAGLSTQFDQPLDTNVGDMYMGMLKALAGQTMGLPRDLYSLAELPSTLAGVQAPSLANEVPVVGPMGRAGDRLVEAGAEQGKLSPLHLLMLGQLAAVPPLPFGFKNPRAFHGTTSRFEGPLRSGLERGQTLLDPWDIREVNGRWAGIHMAKDPAVSQDFAAGYHPTPAGGALEPRIARSPVEFLEASDLSNGIPRQPRLYSFELPPEDQILKVPQTAKQWDDDAVDQELTAALYRLLFPKEGKSLEWLRKHSRDAIHSSRSGEVTSRVKAPNVKAIEQLNREGITALEYINRSAGEVNGVDDPTSYVIFNPSSLRSGPEITGISDKALYEELLKAGYLNRRGRADPETLRRQREWKRLERK